MHAQLVVVRPRTESLRCAACHDDLTGRRFTCPGCGVVLHRDCRLELKRCPTLGCTVGARRSDPAPVAAPSPRERGVLFHLVWLVPGLLSFLWPVWFGLLGAGNPAALVLAVSVGPLIGHGCFAHCARATGDPGSPHGRAAIAELVGFAASIPAGALWMVSLFARAWV